MTHSFHGLVASQSAHANPLANVAPTVVTPPAIVANPIVGQAVSYTAGAYTGNPTITRQWLLDGNPIVGAINPTYTPVSGDTGAARLSVRETATNAAGVVPSTSNVVDVNAGPAFTAAPSINGTPILGVATTYTPGTVTGFPTPTITARQWTRNGADIALATAATYTPVSGDVGATLAVRETAANWVASVPSTSAGKTVSGADADWTARATEADIIADRLNTSTKLVPRFPVDATHWVLDEGAGGKQDHWSLDTTLFPPGSNGSWRCAVLNTDSTGRGQVGIYYGNQRTFTKGDTFWYGFNFYEPPEHAYQPWAGSAGEGPKRCIHSHSSGTNQPFELVFQVMNAVGAFTGYHQDGVNTAVPEWTAYSSINNPGADFRRSPGIDRGANPLSGTNPDTGAAWTAEQQERARFGFLQSSQSQPQFKRGLGDPFTGDFRSYPNEWIEGISRCIVGDSGVANSRWTVWIKRQNGAPLLLWDDTACKLGGSPQAQFETMWLLPYVSNGLPGGRSASARTNNLPWLNIYTFGNSTPIGTGTLTYNPANQRLTWAGQGESAGAAVGFSLANGISTRSVISGSNTDSYVVVEATSTPPSTGGIVTEQVTVVDGRKDTFFSVADVRVSTTMLKFKGGVVPPGMSTLAQAAATMAPRTWKQLTTPANQTPVVHNDAWIESKSMTLYGNKMQWNAFTRSIEMVGADHGTATSMNYVRYLEASHAWVAYAGNDEGLGDSGAGVGHNFDQHCVNPYTGDGYYRLYGSGFNLKKAAPGASSFATSLPLMPSAGININCALTWWSGSFTGSFNSGTFTAGAQGCLMGYAATVDGEVFAYNPLNGQVDYKVNAAPGTFDTYQQVIAYSPLKNCAVYGGSAGQNGFNGRQLWKLSATGTVTAMPLIPSSANRQIGVQRGQLINDPVTGNFLVLTNGPTGELWELNPDNAGSWTQITSFTIDRTAVGAGSSSSSTPPLGLAVDPSASQGAGDGTMWCDIPEYGVVALVVEHPSASPGFNHSFWLYKHG